MDELRLRLDESNDMGWGWLKLDVLQVKVPFVGHSSARCYSRLHNALHTEIFRNLFGCVG